VFCTTRNYRKFKILQTSINQKSDTKMAGIHNLFFYLVTYEHNLQITGEVLSSDGSQERFSGVEFSRFDYNIVLIKIKKSVSASDDTISCLQLLFAVVDKKNYTTTVNARRARL